MLHRYVYSFKKEYRRPRRPLLMTNTRSNSESAMRLVAIALVVATAGHASSLPSEVRFLPGPVNGLLVAGKVLVYGDPGSQTNAVPYVLFTHARRDMVWAGAPLVRGGARSVVPAGARPTLAPVPHRLRGPARPKCSNLQDPRRKQHRRSLQRR